MQLWTGVLVDMEACSTLQGQCWLCPVRWQAIAIGRVIFPEVECDVQV